MGTNVLFGHFFKHEGLPYLSDPKKRQKTERIRFLDSLTHTHKKLSVYHRFKYKYSNI